MTELRAVLHRAGSDPCWFAEHLVGRPLWEHQREVVESPARYRVLCAGRQVGKSALLAVLALHDAFRAPDRLVLIVSAGDTAAKRLLEDVAALAKASDLLTSMVVKDDRSEIVLVNGSRVLAVPASARQIRGWAVDLLIVDEAGFVENEVWRAAEPTIIARPGSRVVLSSSPWGGREHFFRRLWLEGMEGPGPGVRSWHWPSITSPLVDEALLESIRRRENPDYFAREYEAVWIGASGSYLSEAELDNAVADYVTIDPARAGGQMVVGGVDFGMARDANTLVLLGVANDVDLNPQHRDEPVYFVAHLEEHFRMPYAVFVDRIVDVADQELGGFYVRALAAESNGVGAYPSEALQQRAHERRTRMRVVPVHTDSRRKVSMFGTMRGLLQEGRLVLPRHPALLRQLAGLEFEVSDAGNMRISVPESVGHDDLAMALGQALSCVRPSVGYRLPPTEWGHVASGVVTTSGGTTIAERPSCVEFTRAFRAPVGGEKGDGW